MRCHLIGSIILASEITLTIIVNAILVLFVILIALKMNSVYKRNVNKYKGIDLLTKKYNQEGFVLQLEKITKIDRWTVICFDVDSFKQINNTNSFKFGNDVIIDIAKRVSDLLQDNGIVARVESNRYLIGYPQGYKSADELILQIKNAISVLDYSYIRLELKYTFGYYSNSFDEDISSIVDKAIDEWMKAKKEKAAIRLENITSVDNTEIATIVENAKAAQIDANAKLESAQAILIDAQKCNENAENKLEQANKTLEEANSLKLAAESKILEAKSIQLEGENAKSQAQIMIEEANRIKAEALKIQEENKLQQIEFERNAYDVKLQKEQVLREKQEAENLIRKANEKTSYSRNDFVDYYQERRNINQRDTDYGYKDKDTPIIINTQQDTITEKRVEEIINSVLKQEQQKSKLDNHLSANDIELMVRRIVMESISKDNAKEEVSHDVANDTEKLTSEELESAIRKVMSEYMSEEYKENQTKKEQAREAAEKEKITELLSRLIELQEKAQEEKKQLEVASLNDQSIETLRESNDSQFIYDEDDDGEDDDEDEEESSISEEFIQQLDSKLDINQFQRLMDEYMQKYQQRDQYEPEISQEKAKFLSFIERINISSRDSKTYYNMIKNAIMEHEQIVNNITNRYDTFKVGRRVLFKITYVGKTLKLYLPLDPSLYPNGQYPHQDVSNKKKHANTPYMMKIKSNLGLKRALVLIDDAMIKLSLNKIENYKNADYVARNRNLIMKMTSK